MSRVDAHRDHTFQVQDVVRAAPQGDRVLYVKNEGRRLTEAFKLCWSNLKPGPAWFKFVARLEFFSAIRVVAAGRALGP